MNRTATKSTVKIFPRYTYKTTRHGTYLHTFNKNGI